MLDYEKVRNSLRSSGFQVVAAEVLFLHTFIFQKGKKSMCKLKLNNIPPKNIDFFSPLSQKPLIVKPSLDKSCQDKCDPKGAKGDSLVQIRKK